MQGIRAGVGNLKQDFLGSEHLWSVTWVLIGAHVSLSVCSTNVRREGPNTFLVVI